MMPPEPAGQLGGGDPPPVLPGRTHDLPAARTHKIIRICERQGVSVLADMAYIGAGEWVTTPKRQPLQGELAATEQTVTGPCPPHAYPSNGQSPA